MRGEIIEFFIIKQIKKPRLVLCSVVKHLGSGRALKKWGKTLDCVSCFPLHFFRALPLPACFTTEHSTVEASLFVKDHCQKCANFVKFCLLYFRKMLLVLGFCTLYFYYSAYESPSQKMQPFSSPKGGSWSQAFHA